MPARRAPRRTGWLVAGVSLLVGLTVASDGAVAAAARCRPVDGRFTLQPVTGPACLSPVGVCATGVYSGDIEGTSTFVGTSLIPTADTPTTAVVLLTGDNTIHTRRGDLLTKDAIVLRTTGDGDFAEVDTIVGGAGGLVGASGVLRAQGTFTAAAGGGGRYVGEVCVP
jgi:hypothetical protein